MPHKDPAKRARYQAKYQKDNRAKLVRYMSDYNRTPRHRWSAHRGLCAKRGIEFSLAFDEYLAMDPLPCHYCGDARPATGIGLDRIDNARGYSKDNVLPCCAMCNHARNDNMTSEEFMTFIAPAIRALKAHRLALQKMK